MNKSRTKYKQRAEFWDGRESSLHVKCYSYGWSVELWTMYMPYNAI